MNTTSSSNTVDLYRFEYHFRYTSHQEQAEIKQELQRAKLSQSVTNNCTKLYVFNHIQHTLQGLVNFRDVKELSQVNLDPEVLNLESGDDQDGTIRTSTSKTISDHLLCHIYSSDQWNNIYTRLDLIIPEFIVSKKPELIVTCILNKVRTFERIGEDVVNELQSIYSHMLHTVGKVVPTRFSDSSELILIPEIQPTDYGLNHCELNGEDDLKHFLNLNTLKDLFGEHKIELPTSFLDSLIDLNSGQTMSLTNISRTMKSGVDQIYRDPATISSVLQDESFKGAIKQADHLNSLVRGLSVVNKFTNQPLVVESLDFLFNKHEPSDSETPVFIRLNYLEHSDHYKSKKWFRQDIGPVAFRISMIIDSIQQSQSCERVELKTPEDEEMQRRQYWLKQRQQKQQQQQQQEEVRGRGVLLHPEQLYKINFDFSKMSKYFILMQHPMQLLCDVMAHYDKLARFEKIYHTPFLELSKTTCAQAPLILRTALTHMSYAQEKQLRNHSYERLEFLGDALLHVCVAIFTHQTFTTFETFDGDWYSLFVYLITNKHLYEQAVRMKLDEYILMSKAPSSSTPPKVVADLFESLLGAIYLVSKDTEYCHQFVNTEYIAPCLSNCDLYREKVLPRLETDADSSRDGQMVERLLISQREQLDELETSLGYKFNDRKLLLEALVHYTFNESRMNTSMDQYSMDELKKMLKIRKNGYYLSYTSTESTTNGETLNFEFADFNRFNCEKLRFVGIALCKFLAAEYVFMRFPECDPRQMTLSIHCLLDNSDICIQHAINQLNLSKYILHKWPSVDCHVPLCESFFALLGAVFVDSGYDLNNWICNKGKDGGKEAKAASNLFSQLLLSVFDENEQLHPNQVKSPIKNYLQHLCQIVYGSVPSYQHTENEQSDTKYECTIVCGNQTLAEFKGSNRRAVEREACNMAVNTLLSNIEKSIFVIIQN